MLEASPKLQCPACKTVLPQSAMASGQRLARCKECGQMVRRAIKQAWPASASAAANNESDPTTFEWDGTLVYQTPQNVALEIGPTPTYPAMPCPYCEYVNQAAGKARADGQQFCTNCSANLKKTCLNCDQSLYVLDHFCRFCRADQEKVQYEIEALYWQHFNEGKRLALAGRWEDAEQELSLFFAPDPHLDRQHVRRAHQIYVSNIAPQDGGEGLHLYHDVLEGLRRQEAKQGRGLQRRKYGRWVAIGAVVLGLGLFSSTAFGAWWLIFLLVYLGVIGLAVLAFFAVIQLGLS